MLVATGRVAPLQDGERCGEGRGWHNFFVPNWQPNRIVLVQENMGGTVLALEVKTVLW